MVEVGPLLAATALVGVLHMSAPDHWVTLCILAQTAKWTRARLVAVSVLTAFGHVALSIILGFSIVILELGFARAASQYLTTAIGVLMLVGGTLYGVRVILSHPKEDYHREAEEKGARIGASVGRGVGYFAVLGAALSPDLSVLPIFFVAAPAGLVVAAYTALVFAISEVLSLTFLVLVGSRGLSEVFERVPPKYNDALVGFVIAAVGVYILIVG